MKQITFVLDCAAPQVLQKKLLGKIKDTNNGKELVVKWKDPTLTITVNTVFPSAINESLKKYGDIIRDKTEVTLTHMTIVIPDKKGEQYYSLYRKTDALSTMMCVSWNEALKNFEMGVYTSTTDKIRELRDKYPNLILQIK